MLSNDWRRSNNRRGRRMGTLATLTRRLDRPERTVAPFRSSAAFRTRPQTGEHLAAVLSQLLDIELLNRPADTSLAESLRTQTASRLARALLLLVERCDL